MVSRQKRYFIYWPFGSSLKVYAEDHCLQSWYDVYVDGVKVKTLVLDRGESRYHTSFLQLTEFPTRKEFNTSPL